MTQDEDDFAWTVIIVDSRRYSYRLQPEAGGTVSLANWSVDLSRPVPVWKLSSTCHASDHRIEPAGDDWWTAGPSVKGFFHVLTRSASGLAPSG